MSSLNQPAFQPQHNEALIPWAGCSEGSNPPCKTVLSDLPSLAAEVAPAILHNKCTGTVPGTCAVTHPPHQRWQMQQQEALLGLQELWRAPDGPSEKHAREENCPQHEEMISPPVASGHAWTWMKAVWDSLQLCFWLMGCLWKVLGSNCCQC